MTEDDKPIQTFVIPHSHMDVGWVYTIQAGPVESVSEQFPPSLVNNNYSSSFKTSLDLFCSGGNTNIRTMISTGSIEAQYYFFICSSLFSIL